MNDEWAVIRNCGSLEEALVLKSALEAEGVEVLIPDEHTVGIQPFFAIVLSGVKVMVRSEDVDRAGTILDASGTPETNVTDQAD